MSKKVCENCHHMPNRGRVGAPCVECFESPKDQYSKWQPPFAVMVAGLAKPGQAIIDSLTPDKADLLHMVVGVAGEAGELLDAIKKHVIYNKPIDRANVVEELGDIEFYMERIRQILFISRQETIDENINKLGKRYEGMVYSDTAAQQRADKGPVAGTGSEGGDID